MDCDSGLTPTKQDSCPPIHECAPGSQRRPKASCRYVCTICRESFSDKYSRNQHLRAHDKVKIFKCDICLKAFLLKSQLDHHNKVHKYDIRPKCNISGKADTHTPAIEKELKVHKTFKCDRCEEIFLRKIELRRHMQLHKKKNTFKCEKCNEEFPGKRRLLQHTRDMHSSQNQATVIDNTFTDNSPCNIIKRLYHSRGKSILSSPNSYNLVPNEKANKDLAIFLDKAKPELIKKILEEVPEKKSLMWYVNVEILLQRINAMEEMIIPHFKSKCFVELSRDSVSIHIEQALTEVMRSFNEFLGVQSTWSINRILRMELSCIKYTSFC